MHQAQLQLELLDNVVQSVRSATVGEHKSLDVIAGSALLGWAASKLYTLLGSDAFMVFHSGKVRFGDGLPATENGEAALPMPLCWHEDKVNGVAYKNGVVDAGKIYNWFHQKPNWVKQPRQLRNGFITQSGQILLPAKSHSPHIAIVQEPGIDNKLFGYESLGSTQHYIATITADDDISVELFGQVVSEFRSKVIRIGRSKSTEYGRVKAEILETTTEKKIPEDISGQKELTLWLRSDMAIRDNHGSPVLLPTDPTWIGLPKGRITNAFIRYRSYAPYNAYREARDVEQQVLLAGSVIKFEFDEPLTKCHAEILAGGLGTHREVGLGAVVVNPKLLEGITPCFESTPQQSQDSSDTADRATQKVSKPRNSLLIPFLEKRARRTLCQQDSKQWAVDKLEILRTQYLSARNYNGIKDDQAFGPGRSQWRRVYEATTGVTPDEVKMKLFTNTDCVCREGTDERKGDDDWSIEISKGRTLSGWLNTEVKGITGEPDFNLRLQWLTRLAETLRDNPKGEPE